MYCGEASIAGLHWSTALQHPSESGAVRRRFWIWMGGAGLGLGEESHMGQQASSPSKERSQASSLGDEEPQGGHLDELGCQATGLHKGLRGSGRAEK